MPRWRLGKVWNRLADVPQQFRPVCERVREETGRDHADMFGEGDPVTNPQDNAFAEKTLAQNLGETAQLPSREASSKIIALEERHRARRDTLWAKLGEAPLAKALEPLARLAAATETTLPGNDLAALASAYAQDGWRADAALIETIDAAGTREDIVARAAGTLYRPWVDALARRFRAAYEAAGEPALPSPLVIVPGTVVLFVDGLRMDVGRAVSERLSAAGGEAALGWRLSPIPSVTATAKALVTPVGDSVAGRGDVEAFLPLETSSGRPASAEVLRKAMLARGIQVLERGGVARPEKTTSIGYAECGNIDKDGHNMGLRLAGQVENEVARISEYAIALKAAGWPRVRIVTDHGWLLMPGGFRAGPPAAIGGDRKGLKGGHSSGRRSGRVGLLAVALGQVRADRDAFGGAGVPRRRSVFARGSLTTGMCDPRHRYRRSSLGGVQPLPLRISSMPSTATPTIATGVARPVMGPPPKPTVK